MVSVLLLLSAALAGPAVAPPGSSPTALERSVVRLVNTSQRADWRAPWNPGRVGRGTGSGFVIEGGRILTNAHVVADSKNLVLLLHGDANPHDARIVAIGHDCDLALVEPVDPRVLAGIPALPLGEIPARGDEVITLGYPAGGRWISTTRGTISRFDVTTSVHSGSAHLSVQTDAAINPGNSGGPVVRAGKVVGVAFQASGGLENVGYFIPPEVVRHFLGDVAKDKVYDGFPQLDVVVSNLDSPAARRRAGMAEGETGVRVDFVHPGSDAREVVRPGDILLELDGEKIANDGTFAYGDQQLQLQAILDRFYVGDRVPMRVLRGGERLALSVPVTRSVYPNRAYETLPRYLVYAGLVFVQLDREYYDTFGGTPDNDIAYEYLYRQIETPDAVVPSRVVLLRRLDHEVNAELPALNNAVVDTVNGVEVHTLEELDAALHGGTSPHVVIEFAHIVRVAVLDRKQADAAHAEILRAYSVPADRRL